MVRSAVASASGPDLPVPQVRRRPHASPRNVRAGQFLKPAEHLFMALYNAEYAQLTLGAEANTLAISSTRTIRWPPNCQPAMKVVRFIYNVRMCQVRFPTATPGRRSIGRGRMSYMSHGARRFGPTFPDLRPKAGPEV
jgi:hypothetical protein